jgi:hypothetical protein
LRIDGVDIDLPSRKEEVLKYLKNNKGAGAYSIVAKLLKNGGPNLMNALLAVIQQVWTSETLPRRYCVQCTRRAINSIVKTIEGFAS